MCVACDGGGKGVDPADANGEYDAGTASTTLVFC